MLRNTKILLISLALTVILIATTVAQLCPSGDLNEDCKIDFYDLRLFVEQWLDVGGCSHPACADLDGINGVNMADYAILVNKWLERGIALVINEFMASNSSDSGISDPQGDYDDWLEIYNFGDIPIDLAGMYLTDDLDEPTVWRFPDDRPSETTIEPDDFVVIWADKDVTDTPGLHADFKLDADGEEIGLFDTNGITLIDGITFGGQTGNISYGRYPDANDDMRFFAVPTPAEDNNDAYLDFVADTKFSHNRGFYDDPFNLCIVCSTSGADIYYTTDGSAPIENDINTVSSTKYTGPVTINSNSCVRAAAIKTGWMPSNTDAHTYIFDASETIKAMPVVCLVGDEYKSLYEPDGIMAIVGGKYVGGVWTSDPNLPVNYNNPIQRGREYERPVSFELIDLNKGTNFQENCGIRVHGSDYTRPRYTRGDNWLCNNNKFSFNLWFRSEYGNNRLEYDIFPFIDVDRYKSIVLRAGHNDICSPFVKDEWARRLFLEMGRVQVTGTFANLYINGQYKYYYNPTARVDEEFFQEWYDSDNDFDVITNGGLRDGDDNAWNNLRNYANNQDLANTTNYEYVASKFDIPTFIDFLILEIHIGNFDWPGNNWDVHRERSEDGILRYSVWDAEGLAESYLFGNNCEECYKTAFEDFPTWWNPDWGAGDPGLNHMRDGGIAELYRALKANAEFRLLFADRIHKHFRNSGILTESHLVTRWWEVSDEVSDVLPYQSTYVPNVFLPVREPYVLDAFEDNDLFDQDFGYPIFNVNGSYQHGGYISASDTITITQSTTSGTVYYTIDGNDPRTPGIVSTPDPTVLVSDGATKKALVPTGDIGTSWRGGSEPYDDSSWRSGPRGVGYERDINNDYDPFIGINVETDMFGNNSTCYVRIPFTVDGGELPSYETMTLKVRYDDAFVAYINGEEVERVGFTGTPVWNSNTTSSHEASSSWNSYDITDHIGELQAGDNIIAIHGLNNSTTSSDFLISVELEALGTVIITEPNISSSAIECTGGFTLNKSTHLKSRIYNSGSGQWSVLNEAVYALPEVVDNLRVSELMYHPQDTNDPNDPNEEYIELKNIGGTAINLNLVSFTNGIDFTFGPVELAAGEHILVIKEPNAFEAAYGTGKPVAGQYTGSLANGGERIRLEDALGTTILDFEYKDGWRDITDGEGFSLTVIEPSNPDVNSWSEKDAWRASVYSGGSPGTDDSGILPNPDSIVINEVLAHSPDEAPDWIELYNTTGANINISGWYLSDSDVNMMKYEFKPDTIIEAGDYLVLYEDVNFGDLSDPGCHTPFALSENGELVYLRSAESDVLTGYRTVEDFGASETDISFGRYYKQSTDNYNFISMSSKTPGAANAYPKVGPIVINEIMYHPDWPINSPYDNDSYEYIELYNNSGGPITLYDSAESEAWKLTNGIDYTFPTDTPVTIASGGYIVVVKDPNAFNLRYSVPSEKVFGPYDGKLSNGGEIVELGKPGDVDEFDTRYYIRVDRVNYSDGSHPEDCPGGVDLWPTEADKGGKSLTRISTVLYGNDPNNWQAATPTPGN